MPKKEEVIVSIHAGIQDLTAPIVASIELSKTYAQIESHIQKLMRQTEVVESEVDEDGKQHVVVIENPQLIKWMALKQRTLDCILKLQANLETAQIQADIDASKVVFSYIDKLPPDIQDEFLRKRMQEMKVAYGRN